LALCVRESSEEEDKEIPIVRDAAPPMAWVEAERLEESV